MPILNHDDQCESHVEIHTEQLPLESLAQKKTNKSKCCIFL